MFDVFSTTVIAATFLLAGTVKGVIGLGLPTVSLGLLVAVFDLITAMALLIVPSFVTNLWQAVIGDNGREILLRIWPFLLTATITVWLGAVALTRVDQRLLSGLLGALLVAYSALNLAGIRLTISKQRETWAGPLLGTINGILTGMTGSFVVPGVMFLQAISLSKDKLVQAMGMLFTVSTVALALALQSNHLMTSSLSGVSVAAVIPAATGMMIGKHIRQMLSESSFRQLFFIAILLLGLFIMTKAVMR